MKSVRESFVKQFAEDQAQALERAADRHTNGVHDNRGSDGFKWVIAICLGYGCIEIPSYRSYHGITIDWPEFQDWVRKHGALGSHDGDVDWLSAVAGIYHDYLPPREVEEEPMTHTP